MMHTKWISMGASLGLLGVLAILALLVTRCTPLPRPTPTALITSAPVANQVTPTSSISLVVNSAVSTTRTLTIAQTISHSDWLTFTDPEAGFSIQYPANFILVHPAKSKGETYRTTFIMFNLPNVKMYQEMNIRVEANPNNLPIEEVVKAIYEDTNNKPLSIKAADALQQMVVAGMTAYKTTILPGNTDFQILLPYDKKVYRLALVYDVTGVESAPEAKAIFSQMLGTFQIKKTE